MLSPASVDLVGDLGQSVQTCRAKAFSSDSEGHSLYDEWSWISTQQLCAFMRAESLHLSGWHQLASDAVRLLPDSPPLHHQGVQSVSWSSAV